jgi:hypothetical protein
VLRRRRLDIQHPRSSVHLAHRPVLRRERDRSDRRGRDASARRTRLDPRAGRTVHDHGRRWACYFLPLSASSLSFLLLLTAPCPCSHSRTSTRLHRRRRRRLESRHRRTRLHQPLAVATRRAAQTGGPSPATTTTYHDCSVCNTDFFERADRSKFRTRRRRG